MRNLTLGAVIGATLLAGAPARAEKVREPSSEHEFERDPSFHGQGYHCLATGIRKKAIIKVYAIAFCVEKDKAGEALNAAKAAAGGAPDEDSQPFFNSLRDAKVAKAADMYFVRNVDKGKIAEAYEETLKKAMGADDAEGQAKFLAMVDRDVKEGEHIVLTTTPAGEIHMTIGDSDHSITDAKVAQHIWNAWLGPDGVSGSLKKALAEGAK
jgi:hypothetical protein